MDKHRELDHLFELARNEKAVHSFEDAKIQFTASLVSVVKTNTIRKKYFTTKNWIIMLTTISAISAAVLLLTNGNDNQNELKIAARDLKSTNQSALEITEEKSWNPNVIKTSITMIEKGIEEMSNTNVIALPENDFLPEIDKTIHSNGFDWSKKHNEDDPYQFPTLTKKEIETTKKKKKAMLKALQKYDKDSYAYIPSGTFQYDSTTVSVQAFYMSKTEVTNFEYRTFLFDLLLQDRKAEFLIAKPNQEGWVNENISGGKPYQDHYFSHDAYNEYPVVNVSKAGIELFCKWLSTELRKFVGDKKEGNYNDIRLPSRVEWVKAASAEGKQLPYPWDGQFMRNRTGLYQANFRNDTIETSNATYVSSDITAPCKSYWPNALELYNMSGNVAEMVYDDENGKVVGTAGGSWRSSADEIKIYARDTKTNAGAGSADIGFRVVSTFLR